MSNRPVMKFLLVLLVLWGASPSALAGKLVREFAGSRSQFTAEFQVSDPWLIDWRVSSFNPRAMHFTVTLIDARTDGHAGRVAQTMQEGDGLRLMAESGVYRFRIDAEEADWTIKVIQLNRGEEEAYRPKR